MDNDTNPNHDHSASGEADASTHDELGFEPMTDTTDDLVVDESTETSRDAADVPEMAADAAEVIDGDDLLAEADALRADERIDDVEFDPVAESVPSNDDSTDGHTIDDVDADPTFADDREPTFGEGFSANDGFSSTTPPPPGGSRPHVAATQRLVRDPYARLGGVASGVAHRYGWDVALTRLGVVLAVLVSGGTALLVYFLAWLIIPRATYWPPTVSNTRVGERFTSRDIGVGLLVLGALFVLGIGAGEFGAILVPLALVGGGVWLLMQEPRTPQMAMASAPAAPQAASTPQDAVAPNPMNSNTMAFTTMTSDPATNVTAPQAPSSEWPDLSGGGPAGPGFDPTPTPPGAPVPPRRRGRRVLVLGFLAGLAFLFLAVIIIPIALLIAFSQGDIDIDTDNQVSITPMTVDAIPSDYEIDAGEITLDLTGLTVDDFDGLDVPIESRIEAEAGSIRVVIPEDLPVTIDAEGRFGSVNVFNDESNGVGPDRQFSDSDPVIDLEIDLSVGEIVVERG